MNRCLLIILVAFPVWLSAETLPFEIRGEAPPDEDVTELRSRVKGFHASMIELMSDPLFPTDAVDLAVHLDPENPLGLVGMHGGWRQATQRFQGEIRMPPLRMFDGSRRSLWNVPKDREYFMRLFLHEIAPIYLSRAARSAGHSFYNRPSWIVQGAEEFYSHHAVREANEIDPALGIIDRSSLTNLDYGIIVDNPYIDGYLLFRFVHDEYGQSAALKLITSEPGTTAELLRTATGDEPDHFKRKLSRFISGLNAASSRQSQENDVN